MSTNHEWDWLYRVVTHIIANFQVINGVLYYRDYVEDNYIRALSVPVLWSGHLYNPMLDGVLYCLWFCFSCVVDKEKSECT